MIRREFAGWAKTNSHVVMRDIDKTRVIDLYQDNRTSLKAY